jgi:Ca2+-transporting ATPase
MGSVQAVVVSTGQNTEIGKISKGLKESSTTDIPIQKKMNNFGKWLGLLVMLFWIAVLILRWVITGDVELVQSLTAAMDIMPINIPLLTTVVMLTGVLAMAKRGVIIKDLTSVDSLGRISIVCTDKTGTLTQNKMVVRYICTYNKLFKVTGTGYSPEGDFLIKNNNEFTKIDSIDNYLPLKLLLVAGYLNSNATLTKNLIKIEKKKQEVWDVIGSPTEGALVAAYLKVMPEITKEHYENIIEFPFDSNLKRMSKAIQYKQDPRIFTYTKGASEVVIPICSKIFVDKGVVEYSDDLKSNFMQQIKYFEEQGFRVLSLAYKQLPTMPDESEQSRLICESDLIYLGFVTIADPPRDGVKESVIECNNAGVQVVMITGDSISTAKAIASEISIIKDPSESAF